MKRVASTFLSALVVIGTAIAQPIDVSVVITTTAEQKPISPLIYGINAYVYDNEWGAGPWKTGLENHAQGLNVGARRLGGNTMTSYNWENGFSNSGNDDNHSNNQFQSVITGAGAPPYSPGKALTTFHDHSRSLGAYSLLQLPIAGYVAADGNGWVLPQEEAPSPRWNQVVFDKPGAPGSLSTEPDLNDGVIYVDEEIHFLMTHYGQASGGDGIQGYEIDNEPGLWHHFPEKNGNAGTHSRLHPALLTCNEVIAKNIALATTIRRMDPTATTYGPAMWGYSEFYSLWSIYDQDNAVLRQPSDWATYNREPYRTNGTGDAYRYNKMTWVNAYLDGMRAASEAAGGRLLDVFSVHYYPAAAGTDVERVQAPRSLWDPTYVEDSWITAPGNGFTDGRSLRLIPTLQQSINDFYPGTKLAITEYSFGGRHHVSGGIAQADALGIFGRHGVDLATYFFTVDDYIAAGFKIYRNYDGANGSFGSTSVRSTISDLENGSSYASLDGDGRLHLILINKNFTRSMRSSITVESPEQWNHAQMYSFGSASSAIGRADDITIGDRAFSLTLPPLTVSHLVLYPKATSSVSAPQLHQQNSITVEPNPFSGSARMSVAIAHTGRATLTLYDMLGRPVRTLIDGYREAGTQSVLLEGAGIAAGPYIAVLISGGTRISTPVTILK